MLVGHGRGIVIFVRCCVDLKSIRGLTLPLGFIRRLFIQFYLAFYFFKYIHAICRRPNILTIKESQSTLMPRY